MVSAYEVAASHAPQVTWCGIQKLCFSHIVKAQPLALWSRTTALRLMPSYGSRRNHMAHRTTEREKMSHFLGS
jgi:hypothetical protein